MLVTMWHTLYGFMLACGIAADPRVYWISERLFLQLTMHAVLVRYLESNVNRCGLLIARILVSS